MKDDVLTIWDNVFAYGSTILMVVIISSAIIGLIYFDIIGQMQRGWQADVDAVTPLSDRTFNFTGTLAVITYQYGYWGSIDSTKLTFTDSTEYVLGSQVVCEIGQNYKVIIKETTFKDNHTETYPLSVQVKEAS